MNRKSFFKTLLGGAAVAVIAPQILAEKKEDVLAVDVATIPRGMSLNELSEEYRKTGEMPYGIDYRRLDECERDILRSFAAIHGGRDAIITYYEG